MTIDPAVSWILALSLGLLLGSAGVHKLLDVGGFRSIVAGYRLVPPALEGPAALGVIAAELLAAVLVSVPATRSRGAALAAVVLVIYAAALALNLRRGRNRIDCGCLGFGQADRIAWWMVARNLGLTALALLAAFPVSSRALVALDGLTIGGSVTLGAILYLTAARLATVRMAGASA